LGSIGKKRTDAGEVSGAGALFGAFPDGGRVRGGAAVFIILSSERTAEGLRSGSFRISCKRIVSLHRFRPILLTAAAAILGMIPIAPTVFWGPMAYSIMGGLAVATMLTLVFLPALYVARPH
jgi:multidrug efflux pump